MNEITIPTRTDDEWRALCEQWRSESRERVSQWRSKPHIYAPRFQVKEEKKK